MDEHSIQKSIISYLSSIPNLEFFRHNVVRVFGSGNFAHTPIRERGVGDLVGCYKGKYFEMEIKTERGKLGVDQMAHQDRVRQAGGYYFKVTSLEEAIEAMKVMNA